MFFTCVCPAFAENLPREYFYFPPSSLVTPIVIVNAPTERIQKNSFSVSKKQNITALNADLNRMEAIQEALDQASKIPVRSPAISKSVSEPTAKKILVQQALNNPKEDEIKTISLDDIINSSPNKPAIRLVYHASVIIQVRNVQKFLVMDEGFINVQKLDRN